MASQTKMIIITSDEDIIRQFTLNKNTNTHIIDLDNNKQVTSTETNNNDIINLDFLAQLSEFNSNNDQVYKRALDSPDHNRSKAVKVSKKSDHLICAICGDQAIGYNYDVLSCASCKAFFHRNANQNQRKIRCLTSRGECSVAHETRRKCPRCRLDRCFAMGMRKDFILSEEEKQRRKQRLEENRNMTSKRLSTSTTAVLSNSESLSPLYDDIDCLLMDLDKVDDNHVVHESSDSYEMEDTSFKTLSAEDWVVIESVRSSFLSMFQDDHNSCPVNNISDRTSALISWAQIANQRVLCLINFFRQIDEFEGFHADDRFILIKYNLFPIFPIYKCMHYNPINKCFSYGSNEEPKRHRQFGMLCLESNAIREAFINSIVSFTEITAQDPIILSFLLIILLFSQDLSMSEDEPSLKDPLAVNRAQSYYTRILWNYMIDKQGEPKTCKQFTQLLTEIFRLQSAAKNLREFFRVQFTTSNTVDIIGPLMQTVLHIS